MWKRWIWKRLDNILKQWNFGLFKKPFYTINKKCKNHMKPNRSRWLVVLRKECALCLIFTRVWPKEDLFFEITQITLKTMYPPSHHQNGFVPTEALEHRFFIVYKNLFYCMCLSIISIIYVQFYYQVLLYTFICIFNRLFFVTWSLHDSEVRKFEILW